MDNALEPGKVVPTPQPAKTIGILNIVFAACLLVCSLFSAISVLMWPMISSAMSATTRAADNQVAEQKKADLEKLLAREKAATTEEEKAKIQAERQQVEQRPTTVALTMDLSKMGFDDGRVIAWTWVDTLSSIAINVLMLVAGVGLLRLKEPARRLGVWVAWIKIVRLLILYTIFIAVLVPVFSKSLGDMVEQMMVQQQQAMGRGGRGVPPGTFTRVYGITYSIFGVGTMLLGVIYPAIALWVLNKPGVKAACRPVDAELESK